MLKKMIILSLTSFFAISAAFAEGDVCAKADARYEEIKANLPADDDYTIVKLHDYNFCPKTLTVKKGTKVRFVNVDKRTSHSLWFKEAGKEESDRFFPEEFWDFPTDAKGVFPYLCGPHWEREGMTGTLIVE